MITAFDTDVLIYAAAQGHPLGSSVARLFRAADSDYVGIGSILLLTEVLIKPMRLDPQSPEAVRLRQFLSRIDLYPVDQDIAALSLALGAKYGLKAVDATHLATAVFGGADRFLTNNRKDFRKEIQEIDIVYPEEL